MIAGIGQAQAPRTLPPLENGDRLSAHQFLRRYEAMPEVKKAELINGVVYMPSPVRMAQHAEPDSLLQGWLVVYTGNTPGVRAAANATVRLGPDDVVQPDALLRILSECGGRAGVDAKGYLQGGPELVIEIAASSASLDARDKLHSYRRAAIPEYLLWRTDDRMLDWWRLEDDEYLLTKADKSGVVRSHVFPGLWLDVPALLAGDVTRVLATLQEGMQHPDHASFSERLESMRKANAQTDRGGRASNLP
jgi:Uma2 family endonuclease